MADHLSRLDNEGKSSEELEIDDTFPNKQVRADTLDMVSWYTDFAKYVVNDIILDNLSFHQKKIFLHEVQRYFWDESYFFRCCSNNIIGRRTPKVEMLNILEACHSFPVGGHHAGDWTAKNTMQVTTGSQFINMLMNF